MISNAWLVVFLLVKPIPGSLAVGDHLIQCATDSSILEGMEQPALAYLIEQLDGIPELESLISAAIAPEAPHVITEGGIIRTGFDETLDKYRRVLREGG